MSNNSCFNSKTKEEDLTLVQNVKEYCDNESLTALCKRHEGLYFDIVKRYCRVDSGCQYFNDLIDSKDSNIYEAVQTFKPDKNMAFSSYLAETVKWKCLSYSTALSKNKLTELPEYYQDSPDNWTKSPDDQCEINEIIDDFNDFVKNYQDGRLREIVRIRFDEKQSLSKLASWKQIGKKMGISYETARQIYYRAIDQFKQKKDVYFCY